MIEALVPTVVAADTADAQVVAATPGLRLMAVSGAETAGTAAAAEAILRHGTSTAGAKLLPPMNFTADGFLPPTLLGAGIPCPNGIFLDRVSGNTEFIVYTRIA